MAPKHKSSDANNFLLYLIHKLNFIMGMFVQEKI